MIFKNIFLGAVLIAATAFAQSADSTTNKDNPQVQTSSSITVVRKASVSSLKKRQKVIKPETTWSKIKDLFE